MLYFVNGVLADRVGFGFVHPLKKVAHLGLQPEIWNVTQPEIFAALKGSSARRGGGTRALCARAQHQ